MTSVGIRRYSYSFIQSMTSPVFNSPNGQILTCFQMHSLNGRTQKYLYKCRIFIYEENLPIFFAFALLKVNPASIAARCEMCNTIKSTYLSYKNADVCANNSKHIYLKVLWQTGLSLILCLCNWTRPSLWRLTWLWLWGRKEPAADPIEGKFSCTLGTAAGSLGGIRRAQHPAAVSFSHVYCLCLVVCEAALYCLSELNGLFSESSRALLSARICCVPKWLL